ncbi:MAG TPA: ABC transporter permease [Acidimicrobiales bacterium]|nr:ABC transporter permease [Acidimicrobiales bacterium]
MSDALSSLADAVPLLRVTEREARTWRRFWRTYALSGVLVPLLFLGALGLGLGGLVDENRSSVEGFEYLVFVAPGIMAATALQAAAGDTLWPVMVNMKWMRGFHAAAATSLSPAEVYGGYLVWVGLRIAMNAAMFLTVAALLGGVPSPWGVLAVPFATLGGLAFASPLAAYSAAQDSDVSFPIVFRLVVVPMFLFSGTFFPVSQLPDGLEPVARLTPLWHAVELCRGATTGTLGLVEAVVHVAVLAAFVAAGAWFGVRTFRERLAP